MTQPVRKWENDITYVPHYELVDWSRPARVAAGALAVASFAVSGKLGGPLRDATRFLAISLGLRALLNKDLTQVIGTLLSPTVRLRRELVVDAPADEALQFWTELENYPRFMSFVRHVGSSPKGNLLWELAGPGGVSVRFETFVTSWLPNQTISWVAAPGSPLYTAGTVWVQPLQNDRSQVRVELCYASRAGSLGYALTRVIGFDPRRHIDHDLALMKSLIEERWRKKERDNLIPLTS